MTPCETEFYISRSGGIWMLLLDQVKVWIYAAIDRKPEMAGPATAR